MRADGRRHSRSFLEIQKCISSEVADDVEALIDELRLDFFREGGVHPAGGGRNPG